MRRTRLVNDIVRPVQVFRSLWQRLDERGMTLVELLVTIAIMGIAVVAVLAGLATLLNGTVIHRSEATADTVARSYGEAVKLAVAKSGTWPAGCKTTASGYALSYTPPSSYSVAPTFGACPAASAAEYQAVTVVVTGPRDSETLRLIVGQP